MRHDGIDIPSMRKRKNADDSDSQQDDQNRTVSAQEHRKLYKQMFQATEVTNYIKLNEQLRDDCVQARECVEEAHTQLQDYQKIKSQIGADAQGIYVLV
jgi:hypothetical protein